MLLFTFKWKREGKNNKFFVLLLVLNAFAWYLVIYCAFAIEFYWNSFAHKWNGHKKTTEQYTPYNHSTALFSVHRLFKFRLVQIHSTYIFIYLYLSANLLIFDLDQYRVCVSVCVYQSAREPYVYGLWYGNMERQLHGIIHWIKGE